MNNVKIKSTIAKAGSLSPVFSKPIQRILVVDDDPFFCHRNAEVLIRHGYQVNAAESGEVGWEELQINRYNLLITENELPSLTGVELLKKLRSARILLPVIMATKQMSRPQATRLLRLHPVVTLLKPYTIEEFLSAVKVVLATHAAADEGIKSLPAPPFPVTA